MTLDIAPATAPAATAPTGAPMTVVTFDVTRGTHMFLSDAYYGGERWRAPRASTISTTSLVAYEAQRSDDGGEERIVEVRGKSFQSYLVPFVGESETTFARRRALAVYVNLVQPIVDAYTDSITGQVSRDLGALGDALKRLDGRGMSYSQLVTETARWSAVHGVMAVIVDAPKDNPAKTRAEEQALGVGLRAIMVPPESWAWLVFDDDTGELAEFAYVDPPRQEPETTAQSRTVHLWVWDRAGWRRIRASVPTTATLGQYPRSEITQQGTVVRSGKYPPGVARVPVVFSYFRPVLFTGIPEGVSLVGDVAHCGRQVYQLLSWAEDTLRRAGFSFLQVPTKEQNGTLSPQQRVRLGPEDALGVPDGASAGWVTHPSEPTTELRNHVLFLIMLAYRAAGLEVQADQSAQAQSGSALKVRSRDFEGRAVGFATSLQAFEQELLDLAAAYLGKPNNAVITYPSRYTMPDVAEELDKAIAFLATFGPNIGPEGMAAVVRQAVTAAMSLSDADVAKIMSEVQTKLARPDAPQKEIFSYDYDAGIVTVNEARATKGLGPIPDGDMPVLEWMQRFKPAAPSQQQPAGNA